MTRGMRLQVASLALLIPRGGSAVDVAAGAGTDGSSHRVESTLTWRSVFAAGATSSTGRRANAGLRTRHIGAVVGRFRVVTLSGMSTGRAPSPARRLAWRNGSPLRPSTSADAIEGAAVSVSAAGWSVSLARGRTPEDGRVAEAALLSARVRSVNVEMALERDTTHVRRSVSVRFGSRSSGAAIGVDGGGGLRVVGRQRAGAHRVDFTWERLAAASSLVLGVPGDGWALRYRHRRVGLDYERRGLDGRSRTRVFVPVATEVGRGRVELRHDRDGESNSSLLVEWSPRRSSPWPFQTRIHVRPESDGRLAANVFVAWGRTRAGVHVDIRASWANAPGFWTAARHGLTGLRAFRIPPGVLVTVLRVAWGSFGAQWVSPYRSDGTGALASIWFRLRD